MPTRKSDADAATQEGDAAATASIEASGGSEYKPDETIPGGRYLAADGVTLTNCWGQRIDENGNVLVEKPLPRA